MNKFEEAEVVQKELHDLTEKRDTCFGRLEGLRKRVWDVLGPPPRKTLPSTRGLSDIEWSAMFPRNNLLPLCILSGVAAIVAVVFTPLFLALLAAASILAGIVWWKSR